MKKTAFSLILISVVFLFGCTTQQKAFNGILSNALLQPDSMVTAFIGKVLVKILYSPDSVKCYNLNPLARPDSTNQTIAGFTVNKYAGMVADNYISILQFQMQSKRNYQIDTLVKECKFTPNIAFSFYKGKKQADVLISMDCEMWGFYYNNELKTEDFTCKESLVEFLNPIFTDTLIF